MAKSKANKKKQNPATRGFSGLLIFLTAVVLLIGGLSVLTTQISLKIYNDLSKNGGRSTATIDDIVRHHSRRSTSYVPEASFQTSDGKRIIHQFDNGSTRNGYWSVGNTFPVAYDKADPTKAIIVGPEALKQQAYQRNTTKIIFGVAGLTAFLYLTSTVYNASRKTPVPVRKKRSAKAETEPTDTTPSKN